jgi:hypothetical protein
VNESLIGFTIVYCSIAVLGILFLICGIGTRYEEPLVYKLGLYRGYSLVVLGCIIQGLFWLPIVLFYFIRGLIKGV